jgi:hypothetical protein
MRVLLIAVVGVVGWCGWLVWMARLVRLVIWMPRSILARTSGPAAFTALTLNT